MDDEFLRMRLAMRLDQLIMWQRQTASLQPFLQGGLGVLARLARIDPVDAGLVEPFDGRSRGLEAGIQIDRPEDGFQRIGENRRTPETAAFQLALAQTQGIAQAKIGGNFGQGFLTHQVGAQARQFAFLERREMLIQERRDGAVEHAVAQKLEPFVVRGGVAAMRQRLPQQFRLPEAVSERLLQPRGQNQSLEDPVKSRIRLTFANRGMRFS